MPLNVIDTLKPKNGLDFPIVEAIDVFVEGYTSLADAVTHFATDAMIAAINVALAGKANTSDFNTAVANLQNQINQIVISAGEEAVVAPEVADARVGADSTSYQTLKARLDSEEKTLNSNIEAVNRNVDAITDTVYIAETLTTLADKVISSSGEIESGTNSYISDYVDISQYNKCKITAQAYNGNLVYAFYDSQYNFIIGYASASESTRTAVTDLVINVPQSAKYIVLSKRYQDLGMSLDKGTLSVKEIADVSAVAEDAERKIDSVTETVYETKTNLDMSTYPERGYIKNDGDINTSANYRIFYFTVPCDGEIWINEQTEFCQVALYNDDTFNSSTFDKSTSTTNSDLPTEDNKMSILKGQTIAVVSNNSFELTCPIEFVVKGLSDLDEVAEIAESAESKVDSITETIYETKTRTSMNEYPIRGYINVDTGNVVENSTYRIHYFTVPCDGEVWMDRYGDFCTVAVYNGVVFDSTNFVKAGATTRDSLPTEDNKMSILAGQTVAVVSAVDFKFACPVAFAAKTQKIQIKIQKQDSTHFNILVPSTDGTKLVKYEFIKYQKTWDELSYTDGEGQIQTAENVVSSDYWNNIEVYNGKTGDHIAQGNSNFITKVIGAGAHAGNGHGNEVMNYFALICDGKIFDIDELNNGDEVLCSACRIILSSVIFKVGSGSGNTPTTAFPDLDTNGNPIINFEHKMEMSFAIGNDVHIDNKLIVKQNGIRFEQCHGAMLECYYGNFTDVLCNNTFSTHNILDSSGNVSIAADSDINLYENDSQKCNIVEMYGKNYYIRQEMNATRDSRIDKLNVKFHFYNNRLKCYFQPVIASFGQQPGEQVETFNDGDVIFVKNHRIIELF